MKFSGKFSKWSFPLPKHKIISLVIKDQENFPFPWSLEDWSRLDHTYHLYTSDTDSAVILLRHLPDDTSTHLLKIWVDKNQRAKGIAQDIWRFTLHELLQTKIESIFLEVQVSNIRAQKFYSKIGFIKQRCISGFYSNGESAEIWTHALRAIS